MTLKITSSSGEELIRYRTLSACELEVDSLGSEAYMQQVLFSTDLESEVLWYAHRAAYRYCLGDQLDCAEDEKASLLHLFDGHALESASIHRIEVLEDVRVSALNWISSDLQLADTLLFHQEPIELSYAGGYLCYHRIAVYKTTAGSEPVLRAIAALNAEMKELEKGLDSSNSDVFDERMWALISQLRTAEGLVVVSECTD